MDCHARKDQILLYALDDLSDPEREELRAHLQTGCPYCQGQLAEANAILELLPLSVPPAIVPQAARRRLLEQIAAKPAAQSPLPPKAARFASSRRGPSWLMSALSGGAVAAGITILISFIFLAQARKSIDTANSLVSKQESEIQQLRDRVRMKEEGIQAARRAGVQMINLTGRGAQPMARAELIWEPSHKMLLFHAEDLKTLQPGRAYELWLINSENRPIPAGMFTADAHGHGMVVESLQMDPGTVKASAVTEELALGAATPTVSNILLMGKAE